MLSQIRLSVCLSYVCRLSVCDVGAPYSADWNFRQFFSPYDSLGTLVWKSTHEIWVILLTSKQTDKQSDKRRSRRYARQKCGSVVQRLGRRTCDSMVVSLIPGRRPPHCRSVGTRMGDRLRASIPSPCATSHPGQLILLPSVGRDMSTGQKCADVLQLGLKAGWHILLMDKRVGDK